jgi:hypothetical protein
LRLRPTGVTPVIRSASYERVVKPLGWLAAVPFGGPIE